MGEEEGKRGWAWGKVAEEGGEEGEAHSCGWLIESQQFGQWSPDIWEWSGICNTWLCLWNREGACLCQSPCLWPRGVTDRACSCDCVSLCVLSVSVCVNEWARFFFFPFCLSASLSSVSLLRSVCPPSFCIGPVGCGVLSVHKANNFRVRKEEGFIVVRGNRPLTGGFRFRPNVSNPLGDLWPRYRGRWADGQFPYWYQYWCIVSGVCAHVSDVQHIIMHMLVLRWNPRPVLWTGII